MAKTEVLLDGGIGPRTTDRLLAVLSSFVAEVGLQHAEVAAEWVDSGIKITVHGPERRRIKKAGYNVSGGA